MEKHTGSFLIVFGVLLAGMSSCAGLAFAKEPGPGEEMLRDLNAQIIDADEKQDLPAALSAAKKAVKVAKDEFGPTSLKAADAMNNLANLYMIANRAPDAAQLYQQAILINLEKLDPKSIAMAETYFNLGAAYATQKKYKAAIDILRKSRAIYLEKEGPEGEGSKGTEEMITELTRILYPEEEML
jgi:tetratricopeptide (TPR) repeat protein